MRGDGYVYRRGERWWAGYYRDGTFCREPAKLADTEGVLRPAKNEREAQRFLRARIKAVLGGRFLGPQEERITAGEILDAVEQRAESKKLRSLRKIRSHAKAVRKTFAFTRAVDVSTGDIEQYIKERKDAGRAEATINRELEILRRAYRLAVKGKLLSAARVPDVELLRLDNIRQGFFERAEIEALLRRIPDRDLQDFIEWGFRTGQRKSEIAKFTWDMLDRSGSIWVLRLPGAIAKNKTGRSLGLAGETRTIMERRLARRRLDCPLIFHRTSKGKAGQSIKDLRCAWRNALEAAELPRDRLFHDLRRSAVRTLIRSGVDPSVAMKASGHKTRSMLDRYNIVEETETAAALVKADAYLSTQPAERNVAALEHAQNAHIQVSRRKVR